MRLRAHHLLCLLGFRGLGYSKEFVENLTAIQQRLLADPDTSVRVVDEPDAVCRACPHLLQGSRDCGELGRVARRDRAVLARLGAAPGDCMTWAEWQARLARCFNRDAHARECDGCRWYSLGYCEQGLETLRLQHGMPGETHA